MGAGRGGGGGHYLTTLCPLNSPTLVPFVGKNLFLPKSFHPYVNFEVHYIFPKAVKSWSSGRVSIFRSEYLNSIHTHVKNLYLIQSDILEYLAKQVMQLERK